MRKSYALKHSKQLFLIDPLQVLIPSTDMFRVSYRHREVVAIAILIFNMVDSSNEAGKVVGGNRFYVCYDG